MPGFERGRPELVQPDADRARLADLNRQRRQVSGAFTTELRSELAQVLLPW